ncbi:MAG: hemolysin III family protein [Candidatus Abyssobacteria bacterium SURF_5]|jgi:hemolysin III|uniref:Hemolysin III family protein n=1 Tax=Abyssobacteria bacterium (strain SURF_5) TaxID=2093360 RepID=A0A3A4N1W0_ABYX5|nr:MAG: hemolysin III family protein [Candidatus Abyssubacteria bacterium SURF_5]
MAKNLNNLQQYSAGEEIFNSVTHGIGALLSVAGLAVLVVFAALHGDRWHVISFSIFGGSLICLYGASTLYHGFSRPSIKTFFKKLDHSAIFLLIAGTYTPFMLVTLRGAWGWSLFGIIWTMAVAGICIKSVSGFKFRKLSALVYLFMGWLGVVAIKEIISAAPPPTVALLVVGGLSYTAGVLFYLYRKLPFNHGIWHMFVLCGSVSHYFAVLFILR